ncbi:OsmC family protein [Acetobacter tropicalis]|uniref:Osmotically inducible protein C n=1 Tax=Acetobacter tropicalis TaxID=104102 RepID=A0A094YL23_9PROT|nr:OsmC family protein [Acetobacter tropicalis]KAA8389528.1 OsmC family protein [Acetobacter tropicalis]KAA8390819.1 OsmC family protein [Acetobacter tropicalis]KGB21319.1 Osmotically inducible protein C [Acetobacter tropicalis]MBC9008551.1 OsmC family protein [Acetobacter tropicalis]MDO8170246.1 OsmC family protein [Acetobacter tropicalis]
MAIKKFGTAHWEGPIKEGKGTVSTESQALNQQPYGFNTRFEGKPGTNPEELLGAAHAACFSMALSLILGDAGLTAKSIDTKAEVSLNKAADGFEIDAVALTLKADVPGASKEQFEELANKAKTGCPVSKLFKATITLDATLIA